MLKSFNADKHGPRISINTLISMQIMIIKMSISDVISYKRY